MTPGTARNCWCMSQRTTWDCWTQTAAHSGSWPWLRKELPEQGGGSPDASEQLQVLIMVGEHLLVLQVETKVQGRVEVRIQDFSSPGHELQQRDKMKIPSVRVLHPGLDAEPPWQP